LPPKYKSGDIDNLDMPMGSHKVLLSEKAKVLDLRQLKEKKHAEVAKIYGKNESSICTIMKKGKIMLVLFLNLKL
jgi:hypothetical protein